MGRPRVLLAEDHAPTAKLMRALLRAEFDFIGCVEDGAAPVEAVTRLSPDVTVSDIAMPHLDGIAAARIIVASDANARIVLVTVHADLMLVEAGLAAGVLGYVLKDTAGSGTGPSDITVAGHHRAVPKSALSRRIS
ncbi:response regulator [Luteitalea pratensis]|nr:response regulator transcription factor [Luteitalea pratensis]